MDTSSAGPELSLEELRHVLSNPEDFGLKAHVWYAIDALQPFVDAHAAHTLAARLGVTADALAVLVERRWQNAAGTPWLWTPAAQASRLVAELSNTRERAAPLQLTLCRSQHWDSTGPGRVSRRIR